MKMQKQDLFEISNIDNNWITFKKCMEHKNTSWTQNYFLKL